MSESPTAVTYGNEASVTFNVAVVTGNGEALPAGDSATVSVGGLTTCTAPLTSGGTGGTGNCAISATALPVSGTPYAVTVTYGGDTSLSGSLGTASTGLTVIKATLEVVASSPTVTYGSAVPTITATYVGFVNSETASNLTTGPACSTTYTTTSAAGTSPSTSCSGAVDANYSISYVPGTVTVTQAPLVANVSVSTPRSMTATPRRRSPGAYSPR